jgi:hypothetical protein
MTAALPPCFLSSLIVTRGITWKNKKIRRLRLSAASAPYPSSTPSKPPPSSPLGIPYAVVMYNWTKGRVRTSWEAPGRAFQQGSYESLQELTMNGS